MEYSLTKEANEVNFFKISEDEILNNKKIEVYLVESKIDIYNEVAEAMANKLKENNGKEISTSLLSIWMNI